MNINPYRSPEPLDESGDQAALERRAIKYASRWRRLLGAIIDTVIIGIPLTMVFYTLDLYRMVAHREIPMLLLSLCGIAAFLLVNGILIYRRGQTIGKMICGTVVVTKDGYRVSGNRFIFLRELPVWAIVQLPLIGSLFAIIDVLAIFRHENNCLHDDIAGTRVIMKGQENRNRSYPGEQ